jgi:hypothetical protein
MTNVVWFHTGHLHEMGMLLKTTFRELHVVTGRSWTWAGSPWAVHRRTCCALALRRTAWSEHGMASVNQTRLHCVNQKGKTHSKPLAARHGRWRARARHGMCESALKLPCNTCFLQIHSYVSNHYEAFQTARHCSTNVMPEIMLNMTTYQSRLQPILT